PSVLTTRPLSRLPLASFGAAVSCTVAPTCTLAVAGLTVPEATGGGASAVTVTVAVPLCPSLVAVIVAGPAATPLTSPLPLTVATAVLLLAHVTTRWLNRLPPESAGEIGSGWCSDRVKLTVVELTFSATPAGEAGGAG